MNKWMGSGEATKAPYMSQGNTAVAKFVLKVPQFKEGFFDYIRIVVFGEKAEQCEVLISEGTKVFVTGRIQTGLYDDKKTGNKVYTTDVIAEEIEIVGTQQEVKQEPKGDFDDFSQINTDQIPF